MYSSSPAEATPLVGRIWFFVEGGKPIRPAVPVLALLVALRSPPYISFIISGCVSSYISSEIDMLSASWLFSSASDDEHHFAAGLAHLRNPLNSNERGRERLI
jgi:hypothetical protein